MTLTIAAQALLVFSPLPDGIRKPWVPGFPVFCCLPLEVEPFQSYSIRR